MRVALRLLAFALALATIFGVAVVVGSFADVERGTTEPGHGDGMSAMSRMSTRAGDSPPGLAVADRRVRLVPDATTLPRGRAAAFRFRIVDARGETVRDFEVEHAKRLHLIAVRRDFADYHHVHPVQAADGSWSVPLRFRAAGVYRVYADFRARGADKTVLATDVFVAGDFRPQPLPAPARRTTVDGYDVTVAGAPSAGAEHALTFQVSRGGKPVAVQPYLGADGHLVALRQGDLAYLHVHPQDAPGDRGRIVFMTAYPTAGAYRLFLQFKAGGAVHTAAFTQEVR